MESVTGLTSLETMHYALNLEKPAFPTVSYTPPEIATIYNSPSRLNSFHGKTIYDGTGVTLAIANAYNYMTSDVDFFWSDYSVTRTGTLTNIPVGGSTNQVD